MKAFKLFYFIQSVLKYMPFKVFIHARRYLYRPFFKYFGKNITIHDNVMIKFPEHVDIGENTQIASGCILVGGGGLKIGNNVMIGSGSKIVTSTHNFSRQEVPMREQGLSYLPIIIEDDVWIGFNVVILGGVKIGIGSIIGANALVNSNVSPYTIVGGIPARTLKNRSL